MRFSRTDSGDETVLKVDGTLDAVTAPELRPALDALVAERRRLVTVDLSALRLIEARSMREARRHLCLRHGYADPAYFKRVFTQDAGISPRAFRTQLSMQPRIETASDSKG